MTEEKKDSQKRINDLKRELEEAKKKMEEYLNGWKRSKADYLNLEKKMAEEKMSFVRLANIEFVQSFLPLLDSFRKLKEHLPDKIKGSDWEKGLGQLDKQLGKFLEEIGLERIKTTNEKFNPNFHEAVGKKGKGDKIIQEIEPGYLLHGEIVRPAKVIVG